MISEIKDGIRVISDEPLTNELDLRLNRLGVQIHMLHHPIWDSEDWLCGLCALQYPCATLLALNDDVVLTLEINKDGSVSHQMTNPETSVRY